MGILVIEWVKARAPLFLNISWSKVNVSKFIFTHANVPAVFPRAGIVEDIEMLLLSMIKDVMTFAEV